ncbi:hypothetical protein Gasu2_05410 [Galdieria sulphuraria]|nr:hypothetical protein Gasu2_05410 [Galdieria sulphuraria]
MRWSFLVARVAHWFANEVIVKKLANSEAFQRFAVRSSQSIEELVRKGEQRLTQTKGKEGLAGMNSVVVMQRLAEKLANLRMKSQSFSEALKEEVKRSVRNKRFVERDERGTISPWPVSRKFQGRVSEEADNELVFLFHFESKKEFWKQSFIDSLLSVANSVPLTWRLDGVSGSADMTSLLLMHDPDAVSVTGLDFIHWFVINMTLTDNAVIIPENASGNVKFMPEGSVELRNSNNKTGYHPPCPPDKDHTYIFQVCLINRMSKRLDWITFYDARDIVHRLEGCLCGTLKGVYPRVTTEKRKDISD